MHKISATSLMNLNRAFFNMASPKIVAITETWCNVSDSAEIHLDNYKVYRNDKQSGHGSGVLLYIHCSLNFTPCVKINNLEIEDSIWGSIQLNSNEVLFVDVRVIYRSPSSDVVNNAKLNHVIQRIHQFCSFTQLSLMGDFNYPEINWSFSTVLSSVSSPAMVF